MSPQLQLVQQERRFYFIGRTKREILFTVMAASLDDARQKFRNAGHPDSDALFIIKTENLPRVGGSLCRGRASARLAKR